VVNSPSRLEWSAARIALAIVWSAMIEGPSAFDPPQFVWDEGAEPASAGKAAEHLASLPKPVRIEASARGADAVQLTITAAERASIDARRPHWLTESMRVFGAEHALVLSGGRALRVGLASIERSDSDYSLEVPACGGGGPMDDPWTQNLRLPPTWLRGVSAVFLLGRQAGTSSRMPLRRGEQFDEDLLEELPD
jgi:hypothetical protein